MICDTCGSKLSQQGGAEAQAAPPLESPRLPLKPPTPTTPHSAVPNIVETTANRFPDVSFGNDPFQHGLPGQQGAPHRPVAKTPQPKPQQPTPINEPTDLVYDRSPDEKPSRLSVLGLWGLGVLSLAVVSMPYCLVTVWRSSRTKHQKLTFSALVITYAMVLLIGLFVALWVWVPMLDRGPA